MGIYLIQEIDINQVMLDVQAYSQKEPFVRRGSSRNSFTHSHPYHSPSRDMSLLGESVNEESSADFVNNNEKPEPKTIPPSHRNSHSKNFTPHSDPHSTETSVINKPKNSYPDSPFIRSCDPNRSSRKDRVVSHNASQRERKRKEIEYNTALVKPQKTQGCCSIM